MIDTVDEMETAPERVLRRGNEASFMASSVRDIESGNENGHRDRRAMLRHADSVYPQSPRMRRKRNLLKFFGVGNKSPEVQVDVVGVDNRFHASKHGRYMVSSRHLGDTGKSQRKTSQTLTQQYRLQAVRPKSERNACLKCFGRTDSKFTIYESTQMESSCSFFGFDPNELAIWFFHWIFRQHLCIVALTAAFILFAVTIGFSVLIWFAGSRHPFCIAGVELNTNYFIDAYILSWTTFTTTGYGVIAQSVSTHDHVPNIHRCTGFSILLSFEGFSGLIFTSVWLAIIFILLSRIQSVARVNFSEGAVVRYGSGITLFDENDNNSEGGSRFASFAEYDSRVPCPILEFRVVNTMHNVPGGEIIDAKMSIVAIVDKTQACPREQRSMNSRRLRIKKGNGKNLYNKQKRQDWATGEPSAASRSEMWLAAVGFSESLHILKADAIRQTQVLEEDPSGYLTPNKILSKLECEGKEHPFFKRVWVIRHTLDERSPLLRQHARMMVKDNNGFWPSDLNNAEGVRAAFSFDQLLVSLSGTSNADANPVYAQHIYDIADTSVGYEFVNMLYRDPDDALQVDPALLNDVMEQAGGGGEDLKAPLRREQCDDMIVL